MLKGIRRSGLDLLHILRAWGHGDEIAIVDANYPGDSAGPELARFDGISATEVLTRCSPSCRSTPSSRNRSAAVVGEPNSRVPIHGEFDALVKKHEPDMKFTTMERFAFYDRVGDAYAVVQTGERRLYGNILLKKGIIRPE